MSEAILDSPLRLGLIGSPNSGKTTLFNALTGMRARVGNYAGVTVERREGDLDLDGRRVVVIDLPGTYSLDPLSPDEAVVGRVLDGELSERPNALLVVADACSLERSLLVLAQGLRRGIPTSLALTTPTVRLNNDLSRVLFLSGLATPCRIRREYGNTFLSPMVINPIVNSATSSAIAGAPLVTIMPFSQASSQIFSLRDPAP